MPALNQNAITLLTTANVAFNSSADTVLYTVPTSRRCLLESAVVVAGADAGVTTLSIGAAGAETDWLALNTLSNLDAANDAVLIRPIPATTPLQSKSYAAGTVIEARVATSAGGATNTLYLFGFLY